MPKLSYKESLVHGIFKRKDMKGKIIIVLLFALLPMAGMAQQKKPVSSNAGASSNKELLKKLEKIDSLLQVANARLEILEINTSLKNRYKLYPTENIYTFLELDTKTGIIRQVQWSLDVDKEGSVFINPTDLTLGLGFGSNSFELYPTKNMYQFILIDKTDGRKWHVQWGMEDGKRWIKRIF